jgi:hypothetical protein
VCWAESGSKPNGLCRFGVKNARGVSFSGEKRWGCGENMGGGWRKSGKQWRKVQICWRKKNVSWFAISITMSTLYFLYAVAEVLII